MHVEFTVHTTIKITAGLDVLCSVEVTDMLEDRTFKREGLTLQQFNDIVEFAKNANHNYVINALESRFEKIG